MGAAGLASLCEVGVGSAEVSHFEVLLKVFVAGSIFWLIAFVSRF